MHICSAGVVADSESKLNRLRWYKHLMRRREEEITKRGVVRLYRGMKELISQTGLHLVKNEGV